MRWLAVDPGEARVGLAICDPEERLAVPLEVVPASAAFPAIRAIVRREAVGGIVVGLPLLPSGDEGDAAAMARRLGARIASALGRDAGLRGRAFDDRGGGEAGARGGGRQPPERRSGGGDLARAVPRTPA